MIQQGSIVRHRTEGWRGTVIHVYGGPQLAAVQMTQRTVPVSEVEAHPNKSLLPSDYLRRVTVPLSELELEEQRDPSQHQR